MAGQERIQKKPQARDSKGRYTKEVEPTVPENAQELKDALDDLLDEIDAVLEENAEEFVKAYVQKGGQ